MFKQTKKFFLGNKKDNLIAHIYDFVPNSIDITFMHGKKSETSHNIFSIKILYK